MAGLAKLGRWWEQWIHPYLIAALVISLCAELLIGLMYLVKPVAWAVLRITGLYVVLYLILTKMMQYAKSKQRQVSSSD